MKRSQQSRQHRRRGNVVTIASISMTAIVGFTALTIDTGHMCMIRGELQRSADAAALAGASALISDNLLKENYDPTSDVMSAIFENAALNLTGGALTEAFGDDIVIGFLDEPLDADEAISTNVADYNAVTVTMRRDAEHNGAVKTFFASVLGFDELPLQTSATAIIDDRFAGFRIPNEFPGPLTPFTISVDYYEEQLANGPDNWTWNPILDQPQNIPDQIGEIWIYPEDNNTNGNGGGNLNNNNNNGNGNGNGGGGSGGGNFGTLNIGLNQQGTQPLGDQIANGVSAQDLINEIGTDTVMFFDDDGNPITHQITGNPGLSGGISAYVELRIGDVIGFFLHDGVVLDGSNATFNIVDMRFGRVMEIDLTGNPQDKRLVIQPVIYSGGGLIIDPEAESSGGSVYALQLVR